MTFALTLSSILIVSGAIIFILIWRNRKRYKRANDNPSVMITRLHKMDGSTHVEVKNIGITPQYVEEFGWTLNPGETRSITKKGKR